MAQDLIKPRGFGRTELDGCGHIIETDEGDRYSSSSNNLKYVLSTFNGFAKDHSDHNMILKQKDDYGREKPIAKSVLGRVSLLILFY